MRLRGAGSLVVVSVAVLVGGSTHAVLHRGERSPSDPKGEPATRSRPARTVRVVRIVDGDTLVVGVDGRRRRVRLIGVDAPETWARHDCFGVRATRMLRRLAPPGTVLRVVGDREPDDRYGRRLRYAWNARGTFVNAALIRAGAARAMVVPPDDRFAGTFRAAEATARREGVGLWAACVSRRGGDP